MTMRPATYTAVVKIYSVCIGQGEYVSAVLAADERVREHVEISVTEDGVMRICLKKGSAVKVTTFEEVYG